jgi:hypothetical protein
MKRFFNTAITMIILAGAFTASAYAQTAGPQPVIAKIPFDFNVGSKNLPAGKYTITVVNPASDRKVLQIRSSDGHSVAITQTTGIIATASERTKLVFHRYGDQYFFAEAKMAGDTMVLAALKSKAERAQSQAIAKAGKSKSVVVIVAE